MKRVLLFVSLGLIAAGYVLARIGDNLSTVNKSGIVQDSALMPIGALLIAVGFLIVIGDLIWCLVDVIRRKSKKSS